MQPDHQRYPTFENDDMMDNVIECSSDDTVKRNHHKLKLQQKLAAQSQNKVIEQIKDNMRKRNLNFSLSSDHVSCQRESKLSCQKSEKGQDLKGGLAPA